jgi:serine/threonine-protein kinase
VDDSGLTKVEKILPGMAEEGTVEEAQILRQRLRLFFGVGLAASLIVCFADLLGYRRIEDVTWLWAAYRPYLFWAFPVLSLGGLLLLLRAWSVQALHFIDATIVTLYIFLITVISSVYSPNSTRVFAYSILLFAHAAFVPSRVWLQVAIGAAVTLSYPLGLTLSYLRLPEVRELWETQGGRNAFENFVATSFLDVLLLSAISVIVTKTLYHFRSRLTQAQALGNYILKEELGRGGMGKVYEATHAFLKRPTAVKVLTPRQQDPKEALARFKEEVTLCCQLTHPNTITIFDFGEAQNHTFYYAMELLQGMDLQRMIERFGPVPPARCVHFLRQICGSLGEAHARGIVHRDVKPSNIFITERGDVSDFVKVLDFGLAREYRGSRESFDGVFAGTPRYTAPECVMGAAHLDGRVDIYMLGSLAYFLLTGQAPFDYGSDYELMLEHLQLRPKPPSTLRAELAREWDEVVLTCLEKDPEDRYPTVQDLDRALERLPISEPWGPEEAKRWWKEQAGAYSTKSNRRILSEPPSEGP